MQYKGCSVFEVIIIDDEVASASYLNKLVSSNFPQLSVVGLANNVKEALKAIYSKPVDLIFLDIDMPDGTGFDLLENFSNRKFEVIFTTAYDTYAVKAFKSNAVDYLLKPIDEKELIVAVNRAIERISLKDKEANASNLGLDKSIGNLQKRTIEISTLESVEYICPDEIIRCEAMGNYTSIFLLNGRKLVVSKTLSEIESLLFGANFYRVHKSHIVNLLLVRKFVKGEGGYIEFADGVAIPVSRRKRSDFFEVMEKMIIGKGKN